MPEGERSYLTIAAGAEPEAELEVKRSRFIARLGHVSSERDAKAFVETVREAHRDARHHVVAWVLADNRRWSSDDGEPQGTGGHPVLDVLEGEGLKDAICVVTRYFGGTLLGAGGLVRAYGGAAREAVANARELGAIVEVKLGVPVFVDVPYALHDRCVRLAEDCGGEVVERLFAEDVTLSLRFPAGREAPFLTAMRELANGEELCRVGEPGYMQFS